MSAPRHRRISHLLTADDALTPGRWGAHITVCGMEVRGPSAPAAEYDCCPNCDCDVVRYCPECAREAAHWSAATDDPRIWSPRPPAVPDPIAHTAQDDSQPRSYYVSGCGHQVPGGPAFSVGRCHDCDDNTT